MRNEQNKAETNKEFHYFENYILQGKFPSQIYKLN